MRDILDVGAETQKAEGDQDRSGDHRREDEAVVAVPLQGRGDEDDKGRRRAADLEAAAAQQRDQKAADDRRIETAVRRRAASDGDGHGEGQGDDGDREPGEGISPELGEVVAFAQDRYQLRREELNEAGLAWGKPGSS